MQLRGLDNVLAEAHHYAHPVAIVRADGASDPIARLALVNYSRSWNARQVEELQNVLSLHPRLSANELEITIDSSASGPRQPSWMSTLRKRLKGAFVYEQWTVGLGKMSSPADLRVESWFPTPRIMTFCADPFVAEIGNDVWVFYEFIDEANKGTIRARCMKGACQGQDVSVLELGGHLSYPFLLRYEGALYMIPEASHTGRTTMYRVEGSPPTITEHAVLLDDVGVVDPTIVQFDGRWWMFGTRIGLLDNAALFAWYADTPFGPYKPHDLNPIAIDVCASRPGGTPWIENGVLHRPVQDSSHRYGGDLRINIVEKLTPTEFKERRGNIVDRTQFGQGASGLHTLARDGDWCVVDVLHDRLTLKRLMAKLPFGPR